MRNEDKFGIIIDKEHQFNSLEEASNYTKGLKEKLKRRASMEEFPVTCAMPEDRLRYLEYCIDLMTKKNLPFISINKIMCARSVLWLVAKGHTYYAIASFLKKNGFTDVDVDKVKEVERDGLRMAKQAIDKVRNTKVPIIGG